MPDWMQPVFAAIGYVVMVAGGGAAVAVGLFRAFGERWLNAIFEKQLAAYRHEQQKELEHLRYRINALMDRMTKVHQREFDVVPEAWSRLIDSYNQVTAFVASLQKYPDLDRMPQAHLDEFLGRGLINSQP